jgi:glyoxylase-like metal-dependent hydrolase (beta-lactamase superfamily II)
MASWFVAERLNDSVIRITEPHVHEFYRANCYRIAGRDFDIQLDFGVGVADLTKISPASGHPVMAIATHAHVDHVGSFHRYARRAGHRLEAHTFAGMDDAGTVESWFRNETMPVAQPPYPGWTVDACRLQPAPLTELLKDGDKVDLGNRSFAVLHLPGHSPGSIALLDERTGEFFSGDAIYDDTLVDDVPGADVAAYLDTMHRLLDLDISIGHGGHGPSYNKQRMDEIARSYVASKQR